jgi:hypothetical protein
MALVSLSSHKSQPASYCFVVPVRQLTCKCPPGTQCHDFKLRVTLRINQPMNLHVSQPHRPPRHTPCHFRCIIAARDSVLSCAAICFFCYRSQLHAAVPSGCSQASGHVSVFKPTLFNVHYCAKWILAVVCHNKTSTRSTQRSFTNKRTNKLFYNKVWGLSFRASYIWFQ